MQSENWRGQWMSLSDLARLMDKSYISVYRYVREGTGGISPVKVGGRIWIRMDEETFNNLARTRQT